MAEAYSESLVASRGLIFIETAPCKVALLETVSEPIVREGPGIRLEPGSVAKFPIKTPLPCRFCPAERVSVPSVRLVAQRVAAEAMTMLVEAAMAPGPDNASVPELIKVLPAQVFGEVRVSVLVLFLVKEPKPEMAFATSTSLV